MGIVEVAGGKGLSHGRNINTLVINVINREMIVCCDTVVYVYIFRLMPSKILNFEVLRILIIN